MTGDGVSPRHRFAAVTNPKRRHRSESRDSVRLAASLDGDTGPVTPRGMERCRELAHPRAYDGPAEIRAKASPEGARLSPSVRTPARSPAPSRRWSA